MVECLQTDNGFKFTNRFSNSKRDILTLFEANAANLLAIHHKFIFPYALRHNGKDERSRRADYQMDVQVSLKMTKLANIFSVCLTKRVDMNKNA